MTRITIDADVAERFPGVAVSWVEVERVEVRASGAPEVEALKWGAEAAVWGIAS